MEHPSFFSRLGRHNAQEEEGEVEEAAPRWYDLRSRFGRQEEEEEEAPAAHWYNRLSRRQQAVEEPEESPQHWYSRFGRRHAEAEPVEEPHWYDLRSRLSRRYGEGEPTTLDAAHQRSADSDIQAWMWSHGLDTSAVDTGESETSVLGR